MARKAAGHPKFPKPSEVTLRLASNLADELAAWPGVSFKRMFGMRALYRGPAIFALLPDKRALGSATSIAYKFGREKPRDGHKWRLYELAREEQLGEALKLLVRAYREASGGESDA